MNKELIAGIEAWLDPLAERIHNITHAYMQKRIDEKECRERQQIQIKDFAKHVAKVVEIKLPSKIRGSYEGRTFYSDYHKGYNDAIEDTKRLNKIGG